MKYSTRTTYGLRAMINLATNHKKDSLSLSAIAKTEGISPKYLEKIFAILKEADLIKAAKGSQGGYKLNKDPNEIKVYDIVTVLEGDPSLFHCIGKKGEIVCGHACQCGATSVLLKVQDAVDKSLKSMKLSDLI